MFKFAFRNVMRNRRRSFLSGLSVFFAALISMTAMGWISGLMTVMLNNYVKYQTGDLRVTAERFVKREKFLPVEENVPGAQALINRFRGLPGVTGVEERTRFGLMLGWKDRTVFGMGMGLDLDHSSIDVRKMLGGKKPDASGIIVGTGLADKLGVKRGDRLLIATRTAEGGLNGIKLAVTGIFSSGIQAFDNRYFYLSIDNSRRLLKLGDAATEIFIFADRRTDRQELKTAVKSLLPAGAMVQDPREVVGPYFDTLKIAGTIFNFFVCFILFMASFVIINTMMMAIYERIREIGMLKAMGMTETELFLNFSIEGGIIGGIGGIPGCLAGLLVIALLNAVGIDISAAMKDLNIPMESVIRPFITVQAFLFTLIASVVVPTLAAMIPAASVRRFTPAEALRRS
jgi:putative ABC transport system permease protein